MTLQEDDSVQGDGTTTRPTGEKRVKTKVDAAYQALRRRILDGSIEPASRLLAQSVADDLGMSPIPVREAFRKLEQEGLLQIKPYTGAIVVSPSVEELEESLVIRGELEALATRLATQRMSAEILAVLDGLYADMESCVATEDAESYSRANKMFHFTIYEANPYPRLVKMIGQFWDQLPWARSVFALAPKYMERSQHEHRELLEALREGDAVAAEAIIRAQKSAALTALRSIVGTGQRSSP